MNETEKHTLNLNWVVYLGLLFVFLKVVGAVSWSWWWVCSPFLALVGLVGGMFFFLLVIAVATGQTLVITRKDKKWVI